MYNETYVVNLIFSGLAHVDEDLNVIPDVARSWQVLDGGRRSLFHLRDDVFWTDGNPVTAHDFEWSWKRNLQPGFGTLSPQYLYDVTGAREYHQGSHPMPEHIDVHALDDRTLEVELVKPVAYFSEVG